MSTTTAIKELGSCLVCNEPIEATAEVEISDLHLDGAVGTANVKVVGFSVSHDCRTKATTDPARALSCGHCELDIEMARSFTESEYYRKAFARENCDRDHADEWVETDKDTRRDLPDGTRLRREWERGAVHRARYFVHRDDLRDDEPVRCGCRGLGPHADRCDGGDEPVSPEDPYDEPRCSSRATCTPSRCARCLTARPT